MVHKITFYRSIVSADIFYSSEDFPIFWWSWDVTDDKGILEGNDVAWIDEQCLCKCAFALNFWGQRGHWNGLTFSWTIRWCRCRASRNENVDGHLSHLYGLSFSCTLRIFHTKVSCENLKWLQSIWTSWIFLRWWIKTYMFVKIGRCWKVWLANRTDVLRGIKMRALLVWFQCFGWAEATVAFANSTLQLKNRWVFWIRACELRAGIINIAEVEEIWHSHPIGRPTARHIRLAVN